ncbi:MAG: hypothetical protein HDQ96_09505 [Lachnospiraceae bacterium]|nr:hypothetical protein [Lachnospiraceae bacterium]
MSNNDQELKNRNNRPKELEWIDLEEDMSEEEEREEKPPAKRPPKKQQQKRKPTPKKKTSKISFHVIFLALIAVVFVVIVFKLAFWGKRERPNNDIENDTTLSFDTEALDSIVPLDSSDTSQKEKDDDLRILFLGNGSLADNKTSDTNIANIVQKKTGATVYNCAIPGSYMSAKNTTYISSYPYDAFSFYYLCTLLAIDNTKTISWAERDMGRLPEEIKEPLDLLQSIDLNELDILCIYYDGADYLEQRGVSNLDNETDVATFSGALAAGLELIQTALPHTRIIVMSPTYVYVVDADGNYSSSYFTDILEQPLSAYIGFEAETCMEYNVSFVDNFYGSVYEEIADEYLKDNILLNEKGHTLLADRFLYALNRFHDYDF